MKKISDIICVFNEEYCILEALKSLKNNHIYEDVEIILVDDCSSNPVTLRILNLLKRFNRYNVINSPKNLGLSNSRNLGFQNALSEYVMPLDADDIFPAGTIDLIYDTFEKNPEIDFVYGNYNIEDDDMNRKEISCEDVTSNKHIDYYKLLNKWILLGTSPCKKELWQRISGYSLKYSNTVQDSDFWIRALKANAKGFYIAKVIYEWKRSLKGMNENFDRLDYYILLEEQFEFISKYQSKSELTNTISEGYYKTKSLKKMIKFNITHIFHLNIKNLLRPFLIIINGNK
jgi:glycosyltransferase involved in cell wall biosynthesis